MSPRSFATRTPIPYQPLMEDLDGDGDQDMVVTNGIFGIAPGGHLAVHLNVDGNLIPAWDLVDPLGPFDIVGTAQFIDVDNDGDKDLVAMFRGMGGVAAVFPRERTIAFDDPSGASPFGTPVRYPMNITVSGIASHSYTASAVGDIDRDGDSDYLVGVIELSMFYGVSSQGIYYLDTGGTAQIISANPLSISASGNHAGLVLKDLDSDGDLDIALTESVRGATGPATLNIFENRGNPYSWGAPTVSFQLNGTNPEALIAANIDQDPGDELIAGLYDSSSVEIYDLPLGSASLQSFQKQSDFDVQTFAGSLGVQDLVVGDFNRDGVNDLIALSPYSFSSAGDNVQITVFQGDQQGSFNSRPIGIEDAGMEVSLSTTASSFNVPRLPLLALADFSSNAIPDIFKSSYRSSGTQAAGLAVFENRTPPTYHVSIEGTGGPGLNGPLMLEVRGPAVPGTLGFTLKIKNGQPGSPYAVYVGDYSRIPNSYPLYPPHYMLHVGFTSLGPSYQGVFDANGEAYELIPLETTRVFTGQTAYVQAFASDNRGPWQGVRTPNAPIATSALMRVEIGESR